MTDVTSWIGGTLCFLAKARDDSATATDYATTLASATKLGVVKNIGAIGTQSSAIAVSALRKGFSISLNGEKSGGEITVAVAYDASDSSFQALRAMSNTNSTVWFKIRDQDGELLYLQGLVANWKDSERNTTTEKGASFVIRQNAQEKRSAPIAIIRLDFAAGDYFPGRFADLVTFTRGSTASYFDAAGVLQSAAIDTPRFDHDPASGTPLGLLIEPSRTNLLPYSAQFDNAAWTKSAVSVAASAVVAPDGVTAAKHIIPSTASASHLLYGAATISAGATGCVFAFAKAAGYDFLQILSGGVWGVNTWVNFDLASGTVGNSGSAASGRIVALPDGLFLCIAEFTAVATAGSAFAELSPLPSNLNSRAPAFVGDGVSGVYLWGAQLEVGASATSHIPTAGAAVTRAADMVATTGLAGTYDIRITYGDDSTADLPSEVVSEGWWPVLSQNRVKSILFYPEGTFA